MATKEQYFICFWVSGNKHIYCKDFTWKPYLECYKDWSQVLTFDNYKDVYWKFNKLKADSLKHNNYNYHVSKYRERNIYLLIECNENDKDDYDYTVLRKVYNNGSIDAAKKYFGNLPPHTFVEHIYECVRYEIPYDDIEKVELEIAE